MALPRLETLAEIEAALLRELGRAPRDKHHEWRTPVLATRDGDSADARTVVLREVDEPARTLRVFTDSRSAKVAQLLAHPQGTLVMWSSRLSWQLRLRVALQVEIDGLALASRWAKLKLSPGAQDYLSPLAPGSVLDGSPAPAPMTHDRGHFAMISIEVQSIDWLELHAEGHRRACFDAAGARWLAP